MPSNYDVNYAILQAADTELHQKDREIQQKNTRLEQIQVMFSSFMFSVQANSCLLPQM